MRPRVEIERTTPVDPAPKTRRRRPCPAIQIPGSVAWLCLAWVISMPPQVWAQPSRARHEPAIGPWVSRSAIAVTSGDYGTGQDTTLTQISETVTYQGRTGDVGVSVPYLFRDGGGVTAGETARARGTGSSIPSAAHGLGDVRLQGTYYWLEDAGAAPGVDLAGWVKLPTADDDDGLGTGGVDAGVGPEVFKSFGALLTFATLQLVVRDTPDGSPLKSTRVDYAAGVGYPVTSRVTGYASLEGGTKSSDGAEAAMELVVAGAYRMTDRTRVGTFVLAGLTDGSPDVGGGASVTVRF